MKVNVENCSATRAARVNAMANIERKFPDIEQQNPACMNAVLFVYRLSQ